MPLLVDGQEPVYTVDNPAFGEKGVIKQKNGVTKALFFKQKDGSVKEYVLKLILDEEYLKSNGDYKVLSISTLDKGFSGFVMITDWNDNPLDQYRLEKGKVVASTRNDYSNLPNARAASCQPICQNVCVGMSMQCCSMKSNPADYCCTNTYMSCYPQCFFLCIPDAPIVEPNRPPVAIYSPTSAYGQVDPSSFIFTTLNSLVKGAIVRVGLSSTTKGPISVFFNLQVQIPNSQGGSSVNMQNMSASAAEYATKQVLRNPDVLYTPSAQITAGSQFRSFMQIYLQTNEGCSGCQVISSPDNPSVPYLKWK